MLELVLDRIFGLDHAFAAARLLHDIGQAVIGLRPDDQIDHRRAAQDFRAFGLGDAAGDADQSSRGPSLARASFILRMRPSSE